MSKDPAFLFYYQDFSNGTIFMDDAAVGAYIRALCQQADKGHLPEKHMLSICKAQWEHVREKFSQDSDGNWYNKRLDEELEKRRNYCKSRVDNALHPKKKKKSSKHMQSTSEAYAKHSEDEDENENITEKETKKLLKKTLIEKFRLNLVTTKEHSHYGGLVKTLFLKGANPSEIERRSKNYQTHYSSAALTPDALVKHWDLIAEPKQQISPQKPLPYSWKKPGKTDLEISMEVENGAKA